MALLKLDLVPFDMLGKAWITEAKVPDRRVFCLTFASDAAKLNQEIRGSLIANVCKPVGGWAEITLGDGRVLIVSPSASGGDIDVTIRQEDV